MKGKLKSKIAEILNLKHILYFYFSVQSTNNKTNNKSITKQNQIFLVLCESLVFWVFTFDLSVLHDSEEISSISLGPSRTPTWSCSLNPGICLWAWSAGGGTEELKSGFVSNFRTKEELIKWAREEIRRQLPITRVGALDSEDLIGSVWAFDEAQSYLGRPQLRWKTLRRMRYFRGTRL